MNTLPAMIQLQGNNMLGNESTALSNTLIFIKLHLKVKFPVVLHGSVAGGYNMKLYKLYQCAWY